MRDLDDPRILEGLAAGALMERFSLSPAEALASLERTATREGRDRVAVATRIVQSFQLGQGKVPAAPHVEAPPTGVVAAPELGDHDLSERERQVLGLIAEGATNGEIAGALYLSLNTVKTYIRTAYRKIGATRRTQAVIWVRENGMLEERQSGDPGTESEPGR